MPPACFATEEVPPSAYARVHPKSLALLPRETKTHLQNSQAQTRTGLTECPFEHICAQGTDVRIPPLGAQRVSSNPQGILQNETSQCELMKAQLAFLCFVRGFLFRASSWTENLSSDWASKWQISFDTGKHLWNAPPGEVTHTAALKSGALSPQEGVAARPLSWDWGDPGSSPDLLHPTQRP